MKYLVFFFVIVAALGLYWYSADVREGVPQQEEIPRVNLYYYDPRKDVDLRGNTLCSTQGLVPLERHLPRTLGNLEETIALLLRGELTRAERERGITTEFPIDGFELVTATMGNGTLTLTFDDPHNRTSGGSCRVSILRAQIEATAKQFHGVRDVRLMPEELLQP